MLGERNIRVIQVNESKVRIKNRKNKKIRIGVTTSVQCFGEFDLIYFKYEIPSVLTFIGRTNLQNIQIIYIMSSSNKYERNYGRNSYILIPDP